jgi:transcriptional regulator with XRE-family HTH domain
MTLADYIAAERGRLAKIANKAGISAASVSRIASGKQNPTLDVLKRIERATKGAVTVSDIAKARAA